MSKGDSSSGSATRFGSGIDSRSKSSAPRPTPAPSRRETTKAERLERTGNWDGQGK